MGIPSDRSDLEAAAYVPCQGSPNQPGLVVVNKDGSPIASEPPGSGGSTFPIYGAASAVAIGASVTMASYTVPPLQTAFWGFNAWGDRYAEFKVMINSQEAFRKILNTANPTPSFIVGSKPMQLNTGDIVTLVVTNIGFGSGNYNSTMLFTNNF